MSNLRLKHHENRRNVQLNLLKLFPKYCFLCEQTGKAHKLTLKTSEDVIKEAALRKAHENMLTHIENEDLLAKEFHVHGSCRRDYLRKDKETTTAKEMGTSDFKAVKREIDLNILCRQKAISMKFNHELYKDGHPYDVRYRGKLKQKIIDVFGDRLCFLKIDSGDCRYKGSEHYDNTKSENHYTK